MAYLLEKRIIIVSILYILLLILISQLFLINTSKAQSNSAEFIDRVTIIYDGNVYRDRNPFDNTYEYVASGSSDAGAHCGKIKPFRGGDRSRAEVEFKVRTSTGACVDGQPKDIDITMTGLNNSGITAYRIDENTVFMPVWTIRNCAIHTWPAPDCVTHEYNGTFKRWPSDIPNYRDTLFIGVSGPNRQNIPGGYHYASSIDEKRSGEWVDLSNNTQRRRNCSGPGTCGNAGENITLANGGRETIPDSRAGYSIDGFQPQLNEDGELVDEDGNIVGESESIERDSCENAGGEGSWFLCPILRGLDSIVGIADRFVISLLSVPSVYYNNPEFKIAWSNFRNLAYMLLVPAMLLMVIGTALGFEFISAYTVKKALPRMVAAILFIALSYELTTLAIIVVEDVSRSIMGFMLNPFQSSGTLESLFGSSFGLDIVLALATFGGGVAVAYWLVNGGFFIALAFMAVAALALLGVMALLTFRQMMIIALILVSPLAIIAWIFPANTKLWGLWKTTFTKLLLLFPVVMMALATGRIFAVVIQDATFAVPADSAGLPNFLQSIMKLIAYVGPFFLIPKMFKLAGGAFANLAGMVNDRERGPIDRIRNKAKERQQNSVGYKKKEDKKASRSLRTDQKLATRYGKGKVRGVEDQIRFAKLEKHRNQEVSVEAYRLRDDNKGKTHKAYMAELERVAMSDDSSPEQMKAAMQLMAQNKHSDGIHRIMQFAATKKGGKTRDAWNESLPDNWDALQKAGAGFTVGIHPDAGKDDKANIKAINDSIADKFKDSPAATKAAMHASGWGVYQTLNPSNAQQDYNSAKANPVISGGLPPELTPASETQYGQKNYDPSKPAPPGPQGPVGPQGLPGPQAGSPGGTGQQTGSQGQQAPPPGYTQTPGGLYVPPGNNNNQNPPTNP
jgi:hypothetical protein